MCVGGGGVQKNVTLTFLVVNDASLISFSVIDNNITLVHFTKEDRLEYR